MVSFAGTSNIKQWLVRWDRRRRELEKNVSATPGQVAEYSAMYAKRIAPHDTYALIQSIAWQKTGNGRNSKAMVWVRPINNPKGGRPTTIYGRVMHKTPDGKARRIWRSGDPHFMFTVKDRAKEKFRQSVSTHVQQFIGK